MAYLRQIPKELLVLYPRLSVHELRAVVNVVFKSKNNVMRQSDVFKVKLPHLGTIRSHGNKRHKGRKDVKKRDVKRKRMAAKARRMTKEYLLW